MLQHLFPAPINPAQSPEVRKAIAVYAAAVNEASTLNDLVSQSGQVVDTESLDHFLANIHAEGDAIIAMAKAHDEVVKALDAFFTPALRERLAMAAGAMHANPLMAGLMQALKQHGMQPGQMPDGAPIDLGNGVRAVARTYAITPRGMQPVNADGSLGAPLSDEEADRIRRTTMVVPVAGMPVAGMPDGGMPDGGADSSTGDSSTGDSSTEGVPAFLSELIAASMAGSGDGSDDGNGSGPLHS